MHPSDTQTITVQDVPTRLHLGVTAAERAGAQEIFVSVLLVLTDPPRFAARDRLEDTVDYDHLIRFIRHDLPEVGEIRLIETVADRVAALALSLSPRIATAEVTVKKPAVLKGAGLVSVSLRRHGHHGPRAAALALDLEREPASASS